LDMPVLFEEWLPVEVRVGVDEWLSVALEKLEVELKMLEETSQS